MTNTFKVTVGRGKTARPSEAEEWIRDYYELEVDGLENELEIQTAKDYASNLIDKWLKPDVESKPVEAKPVQKPAEPHTIPSMMELVMTTFPSELAGLLNFLYKDDYVIIRPKDYLGAENFGKIAAIVRDQLDGEYVSAGKDSYFRIPKAVKKEPQAPEFDPSWLTGHEWKGRKNQDGSYAKGSLSWGWDFQNQFPEGAIEVLKKGPLQIDQYEFSLNPLGQGFVQTKKIDKK